MSDKTRVSFRMPAEWRGRIEEIVEKEYMKSMSEFIVEAVGDALTYYELANKVNERKGRHDDDDDDE